MKILITVISSLLVGLSLASSNFSPIQELQHFLTNKRRIFYALGIAITGYLLLFTGFVISLVEAALQSDAQGFVMWSSLFMVGAGLACGGLAAIVIAKLMVPVRAQYHDSVLKELSKQFGFSEGLEGMLKRMADGVTPPPARAPSTPAPEQTFTESRREPVSEPAFNREMPPSDVLHH